MRRPWKLRWYDHAFAGFAGSSFSTRRRARKRARRIRDEIGSVQLWKVDEQGYAVPGTLEVLL